MVDCPTRTARKHPGGAKVMPREVLALAFVAEAQPITTVHYRKLLEVSPAVAWRSLRKLRDLGLVLVHVGAMHDVNRYTLASKARPVLARVLGCSPEEFRVMRGLGKVNLAHHDGVVDLYVALKVAMAHSKHLELESFLLERDIRKRLDNRRGMQVPDAVAVVQNRDGQRMAVAFEVDLATENPRWVAQHKAVPYTELRETGQPLMGCSDWVVCCTVPSNRRMNRLALASWNAGIPEGLWFYLCADQLASRTILNDMWVTPRLSADGNRARLVQESPLEGVRTNCSDSVTRKRSATSGNHLSSQSGQTGSFMHGDVR